MNALCLVGRVMFAAIFVLSGPNHFTSATIGYAASAGVPFPAFLVPLSGTLALIGGLCVAIGWRARFGAWLLVAFLVPVTLTMHRFWGLDDDAAAMQQRIQFLKNLSMLGGAIAFAYFGAGPHSLDRRRVVARAELAREREAVTVH